LEVQKQHGPLTSDAFSLAVTQRLGIRGAVTVDADFDAIQGVIVYRPEDVLTE